MKHLVVMGVTGCGKSTVGIQLADALGLPFIDGDVFHPPGNVAKMAALIPLTDDDRWPWLADIGRWLASQDDGGVIACSALKRVYRDAIRAAQPATFFVHLAGDQAVLEERVRMRALQEGHFAGPGLLDSQYAALEELGLDEPGVTIDITDVSAADAVGQALALR